VLREAQMMVRAEITALDLTYVAGILSTTTVWPPGTASLPPKRWSGHGRPPTRLRRDRKHQPIAVKELALGLSKRAWRRIEWREGSAEPLSSRFARVRIRAAHGDNQRGDPRPQEWLLIEWPKDEAEPTKYWLAALPADTAFDRMVDLAKLRWRIERDYQELKQEVGLGHFEGRGWRAFHHHAMLCIAAYGFLISERKTIPPLYGAFFVKRFQSGAHCLDRFLCSTWSSVSSPRPAVLQSRRAQELSRLADAPTCGVLRPCQAIP
jgi:SRSO17 transposase